MTDKPASEMSAGELWWMLVQPPALEPRFQTQQRWKPSCVVHGTVDRADQHASCTADLCPYCASPVTNAQINDGDAFPIDERGVDDQKYAHRECAQGAKEP